jgi:hypothetical protein
MLLRVRAMLKLKHVTSSGPPAAAWSRRRRRLSGRTKFGATLAAMVALCLVVGCLPLRHPHAGNPVLPRPGEVFVFGRIRMASEGSADAGPYEFHPFSRNPGDHVLKPDPVLTLELRRFEEPGGAFRYRVYLGPVVQDDGSFSWLLPAGEYTLFGNPRVGGAAAHPEDTQELARFTVPASAGTLYVGTLWIVLSQDVFDVGEMVQRNWTSFEIRAVRVLEERGEAISKLRARFPAIPSPLEIGLMRSALGF